MKPLHIHQLDRWFRVRLAPANDLLVKIAALNEGVTHSVGHLVRGVRGTFVLVSERSSNLLQRLKVYTNPTDAISSSCLKLLSVMLWLCPT